MCLLSAPRPVLPGALGTQPLYVRGIVLGSGSLHTPPTQSPLFDSFTRAPLAPFLSTVGSSHEPSTDGSGPVCTDGGRVVDGHVRIRSVGDVVTPANRKDGTGSRSSRTGSPDKRLSRQTATEPSPSVPGIPTQSGSPVLPVDRTGRPRRSDRVGGVSGGRSGIRLEVGEGGSVRGPVPTQEGNVKGPLPTEKVR